VINNMAHESVGAMPTGCQGTDFSKVASAVGYQHAERIADQAGLDRLCEKLADRFRGAKRSEAVDCKECSGPALYEIMVGLDSRKDLGRPKEKARENKDCFMMEKA